jgi:nascent polypeptide-associated complex subunit alpha
MIPGGLNPRQMKKVMKRMGIKTEEIGAEQVIIRCVDREIVIDEPSVVKTVIQGQEMYQVQGKVRESASEAAADISQEDVELVMAHTGVKEDKAIAALEKAKGDIAQAILDLKR